MMEEQETVDNLKMLCKELLADRINYIERVMGDAQFSFVLYAVGTGNHEQDSKYHCTMQCDITSKNFPDSLTGVLRDFVQDTVAKSLSGQIEKKKLIEDDGREISS